MTIGRVLTFAAILGVSLALSSVIVRRHRPLVSKAPAVRAVARAPRAAPRPSRPAPASSVVQTPPQVDTYVMEDPLSASVCPEGMLLAEGTTCAETHRRCTKRHPGDDEACDAYEPAQCRRGLELRFCVDRYEYPNREGMLPATVVTFEQARSACAEEGKRLCTELEWTFACEGPRGLAFSYGDEADPDACNVGRPAPRLAHDAMWEARDVARAVEQHDGRVAAGERKGCVGPFGARDLIGNVDEWVKSDVPGFEHALHGGRYEGAPTCQTVRQIKQPGFRQLQTGFRCCRDPLRSPREALR
ncbi:MAG TPA: SUMF1/EgtB/PvdO family nonheme iron enzyme [Polyangiaceae bacterium]|nr:SUMF1/EgtB/PvdO family nonheme iron enzyme [Polyangiaceae bacterium]